ncbi:MAG: hypothetical protein WBH86_08240 [Thermogutta sp.]|mgnify:CR=1 FL=1|nr:hypothetical protein [Thermogutta sp.]HOP75884.1 hypothetical protein [Thermogutta sp.]HPU05104.1 hypothetical protein [Thermogutta sp.]HPZ82092.1 hypothetical protein [Thermogutta sp.]HQF14737.1 hypothetical protein [Thermogutta sp.]
MNYEESPPEFDDEPVDDLDSDQEDGELPPPPPVSPEDDFVEFDEDDFDDDFDDDFEFEPEYEAEIEREFGDIDQGEEIPEETEAEEEPEEPEKVLQEPGEFPEGDLTDDEFTESDEEEF